MALTGRVNLQKRLRNIYVPRREVRKVYVALRSLPVYLGYYTKPSFLIIGAQKSGTSAFFEQLGKHPQIASHRFKEVNFFSHDQNYSKGIAWYHAHFPFPHNLSKGTITFEASPRYLYEPRAAGRIYAYNPELKLIALLRDPIKRAYSAWNMYHYMIQSPQWRRRINPYYDAMGSFDEVVRDEISMIRSGKLNPYPEFLRRGLYALQLQRYFDYFEQDQIFVLESAKAKRDMQSTLDSVVQFLSLPEVDWHTIEANQPARVEKHNIGHYAHAISEETRGLLQAFYRLHNLQLYELLGREFDWL